MIRDERAQQQGWMDATAKVARDEALREAAVKARCAFDERGNGRSGHHSEMDWSDGYRDGTLAAEKVILALIDQPAPAPTPHTLNTAKRALLMIRKRGVCATRTSTPLFNNTHMLPD